MNQQDRAGVLVGIEPGPGADALVDLAADEAAARGTDLTVVTVVPAVTDPRLSLRGLVEQERLVGAASSHWLAAALTRVRERHPELEVTALHLPEEAPEDLAGLLPPARVLVVGSRGTRGRPAFALEAVSRRLLRGTRCPVLVLPDRARPGRSPDRRPVVAGVPEGPPGALVLQAALQASVPRGRHVQALHAYTPRTGEDPDTAAERARRLCAEQVARVGGPAGVRVTAVVTPEPAAAALLRQSALASLLVIGSRGPLALAGLAPGSVSHAVLDAARCPVLVVTQEPEPAGSAPRPARGAHGT